MALIEPPKAQYAQIAAELRRRIEAGDYPPGSVFPSEPRLADELGVSRVTVNKAVALLRASGDVRVRRGSGTFVRNLPRITRDAVRRYAARNEGTGAGEVEVRKLKLKSSTTYREIARVACPPQVAPHLQISPGEDVLVRRRVLYANDEPTQIADSYFPWSIAGRSPALMLEDAGQGGSYARLAEIGHGPAWFTEEIISRLPDEAEQRTLDIESTQHVLEIWHIAYTRQDQPVELCLHVLPVHLWKLRYRWEDPLLEAAR